MAPSAATALPDPTTSAHGVLADQLNDRVRASSSSVIRDLLRLVDRPGMLSMAGGLPAPELLPVERVATAAADVLAARGPQALQYGPTEGVLDLRELVAADHGVGPDHVVVTTGSQQGLDLLARALVSPGDAVVVEAPGYLGALQAFRLAGAELVAVPGDADGLRTDRLEARLISGLRPALVYVVSTFQNPSGATLSWARRRHLAELADRYGFVLVEDDPYAALRFRGSPLPRLSTLSNRVVTLGTVSKTIAPGLRVAWLVAAPELCASLVRVKQVADLHTSTLNQLLVAEILSDTDFMAAHLASLCSTYRARSRALVDAVRALPGRPLEVGEPDGGMFAWARLVTGAAADDLLPRALDAGTAFVPGDAFSVDGTLRDRLRLCFTTLSDTEIRLAVDRLASVL